tara:strand:+ start:688 stop:942 length:255 start_codon:yes stop_codon:yes gene_type:complete
MHIIQEIMPNDLPIIVIGELDDNGDIARDSMRVHPIIECPNDGTQIVLEALPVEAGDLSPRLEKLTNNTETESDHETSQEEHKR